VVQLLQIGKLINLAGQGGFSGGGPSDPAEIAVNAVDFDGTNDYLLRGGDYTGAADGQVGSIAAWIKMNDGDAAHQIIKFLGNGGDQRLIFRRSNDGTLLLQLTNASAAVILQVRTDFLVRVADGWKCIMASWDTGVAQEAMIYLGDTAATLTVDTQIQGTLDLTIGEVSIGAFDNGTNKLDACLAQFYFNPAKFIDFAVESNRRKFFSSGGNPVDLGADGSRPTGTAPILFLSGATASWHTNKGTGGGMTENGALTDCATSPSSFPVVFTAAFVAAFI
jgi:hypothetical protein